MNTVNIANNPSSHSTHTPTELKQRLRRTWALTKFELVRLFLTKRGVLAITAFATLWFFILYYAVDSAATIVSNDSFKENANQMFGALGLSQLLEWQVSELIIYWLIALYLFPVFALGAASDQTCADRTRGTLRFISLRATRNEILIGRFLGQCLIIALLIALTLTATISMAWWRDSALLLPAFLKGLMLFVQLVLVILPFVALLSFFNSVLSSAKLTVVVTVLFFGLGSIFINILLYVHPSAEYLHYLIPGEQISEIVGQQSLKAVHYLIPLIQTAFYLFLASILMKRSAL